MLHLASGFLMLRFAWPRADAARRHELAVRWAQDLLAILADPRAAARAGPRRTRRKGAMIAANHVSWADIFAIASVRHTRFIAKSEIRDWPLAGWLAERVGHDLHPPRAPPRHRRASTRWCTTRWPQGDCVGLFPEGTTTEGDRLLKFHSSLFEPAVANRARVYPVAVRYEHPDGTPLRAVAYVGDLSFAQSLGLVIRTRETVVRVAFAPPIEPDGLTRQRGGRGGAPARGYSSGPAEPRHGTCQRRRSPSRTAVRLLPPHAAAVQAISLRRHAQPEGGPVPADDGVRGARARRHVEPRECACACILAGLALEGEVHARRRACTRAAASSRSRWRAAGRRRAGRRPSARARCRRGARGSAAIPVPAAPPRLRPRGRAPSRRATAGSSPACTIA